MKVFHSFLFVLLAIPLTAKAQINSSGFNPEKIFQAQLSGEVYSPPVLFSGSPWYIDDWTRGIVILENGEMVSNVKLRYNGYLDELFWLTPEAFDQVLLDKYLINSFELYDGKNSLTHRFELLKSSGPFIVGADMVFMQLLNDDAISLYVYRKIRETGATTSEMISGKLVQRRVIGPDYQYFIKRKGHDPEPVQLNRNNLLRAFPEYRSEIRRALRQQSIRVRSEAQLISALEIVNTLIGSGNQPQQ